MAEVLNEYFNPCFIKENISSLPVTDTKFQGDIADHLGQLFMTFKMIGKELEKMKDNKSHGVDGISLKLLKVIVKQIGTPLARKNKRI